MYGKVLSKKLAKAVAEVADVPDRMDLSEELDLMRAAAMQSVELYGASLELSDDTKGVGEMRVATAAMMREALEAVIDTAERLSRIELARRQAMPYASPETLHAVVNQVVIMAHDAFGQLPGGEQAAALFAQACEGIRLPRQGPQGTTLTPDMDVMAMDATVPRGDQPQQPLRIAQ